MATIRTRSGRIVKKPVVLEMKEEMEDDYSESEYVSEDDTDIDTEDELCETDDDDEADNDDDADENGNLKGFVVEDGEE